MRPPGFYPKSCHGLLQVSQFSVHQEKVQRDVNNAGGDSWFLETVCTFRNSKSLGFGVFLHSQVEAKMMKWIIGLCELYRRMEEGIIPLFYSRCGISCPALAENVRRSEKIQDLQVLGSSGSKTLCGEKTGGGKSRNWRDFPSVPLLHKPGAFRDAAC